VQHKLKSAPSTVLEQLQFTHLKMILEQIFFAAQRDMNEMTQMIQ
jgi:hypothetical protein